MEVGCGSGRIYERLVNEGMKGQYTGVEVAPEVDHPRDTDCVFAFYVLMADGLTTPVPRHGRLGGIFGPLEWSGTAAPRSNTCVAASDSMPWFCLWDTR